MADRPNYLVLVSNDGQPGIRIASSHATEADAKGMIDMLASLVAPGSAVYLLPLPEAIGIRGNVIEPVNEVVMAPAAEKAPAPLPMAPEAPQQPAKPPVPFRRVSQDQFLAETEAMMENGGWRDADAPISDGGAIS